jgi:FAD/FMN-containing dehydrogenase
VTRWRGAAREYDDDANRMRETYGPNFDRLVALKTKFDPDNLFRMNANIVPRKA